MFKSNQKKLITLFITVILDLKIIQKQKFRIHPKKNPAPYIPPTY